MWIESIHASDMKAITLVEIRRGASRLPEDLWVLLFRAVVCTLIFWDGILSSSDQVVDGNDLGQGAGLG